MESFDHSVLISNASDKEVKVLHIVGAPMNQKKVQNVIMSAILIMSKKTEFFHLVAIILSPLRLLLSNSMSKY